LDFGQYIPTVSVIPGLSRNPAQSGTTGFLHTQECQIPLDIKIETPRCLAYNAIKMEDISVGKSPFGMSLMMSRAGLTPKMDLVDITNCLLTEFGQPMHVFDADKISGSITVRLAKIGEKLPALNGETYELTTEDMIIADDN
jgi:phenylalanyl-tRNA synthetase beta chain